LIGCGVVNWLRFLLIHFVVGSFGVGFRFVGFDFFDVGCVFSFRFDFVGRSLCMW
jgi:hypothetical protein